MLILSNKFEFLIFIIQVICYFNSYLLNLITLKSNRLQIILLLNFFYLRTVTSFYSANQTHKKILKSKVKKKEEQRSQKQRKQKCETQKQQQNQQTKSKQTKQITQIQYCRSCQQYIQNRDHHCVYIGRCVQKQNYQYFFSYLIFSYLLSSIGLIQIYNNTDFIIYCWSQELTLYTVHFGISIVSHMFFFIFTVMLIASSLRSICEGIYVVDQMKNKKQRKRTNQQFIKMSLSIKGLKILYQQFKQNWNNMVGQNVGIINIFLWA